MPPPLLLTPTLFKLRREATALYEARAYQPIAKSPAAPPSSLCPFMTALTPTINGFGTTQVTVIGFLQVFINSVDKRYRKHKRDCHECRRMREQRRRESHGDRHFSRTDPL